MNKTGDYTTIIPVEGKLLEITVKVLPQKTKKTSRWEEICQWGRDFSEQKKISPNKVDKIVANRRYGKN